MQFDHYHFHNEIIFVTFVILLCELHYCLLNNCLLINNVSFRDVTLWVTVTTVNIETHHKFPIE